MQVHRRLRAGNERAVMVFGITLFKDIQGHRALFEGSTNRMDLVDL